MHPELRARFNADFSQEKYATFVRCINHTEKWPADFRISETPIFLTGEFTAEVERAAQQLVDALRTPDFVRHSENAVPAGLAVPKDRKSTRLNSSHLVISY